MSQHERQLLHHIPAEGGVTLTWLASHLALPKSSASVLVKALERRGFVRRTRDSADERRLAIVLTDTGRERVEADTVLEPDKLDSALGRLEPEQRSALLGALEQLVEILRAPA